MIITKIVGGLGNQLFQYAIGRSLSKKMKTEMKLDISFFQNQHLRSFKLNHYNIKSEIATEDEVESLIGIYRSNKLSDKVSKFAEKLLAKSKRKFFLQNHAWEYEPALFNTSFNVCIDGIWQHAAL